MSELKVCTSGFIMHQRKVLLVRRNADEDFLPGFWELPGGKAEDGETAAGAMQREVREEIGVDCSIGKKYHEFPFTTGYGARMLNACFLVTVSSFDFKLTEHDAFAWATLDELISYKISPDMRECIRRGFEAA